MKVVEEIKEKKEVLEEKELNELFYQLARGKDVTEEIETSRGTFIIKFPKQKDIVLAGRKAAFKRNGLSANALDFNSEQIIQKTSLLDVIVISGPAWFENIRKINKSFGWEEMPDANFIDEVFAKAYMFRNKVQEQFEQHDETRDNDKTGNENISSPVSEGLFDGIEL